MLNSGENNGTGMINYTEHVKFRMMQRKISKAEVEDAIKTSNLSFVTRLGRFVVLKRCGDKFLKIIYEKSNDKITVIKVYWKRRLQRRW